MTMDASSEQVEYLSSTLLKHNTPVTYHTLARELKIHQNNAKNVLHEFYAANGDKILASFIITGKSESGTLIKLCKDESSLGLDVKLFEDIHSIHVYSLQTKESHMGNENIVLEELKYKVDHMNNDEYYNLGMIRGPGLVVVDAKLVPAKAPNTTVKSDAAPADSTNETSTKTPKSAGLTSGYVSRKANNDNRSSDRSKTDSITDYTSRKSEAANKPSKRSLTAPTSGYQYKSRKLEKQQPKERVVISNDGEHDHVEEELPEKRENKKNLSDLNNLFIDDFSDESDKEANNDEKEEPVIINENEPESKEPISKETESKAPEVTSKKTPTPTPRTEIKTEPDAVDDDGYLTSFKSNNPVKNKHDKKKTQSSLMNFFKPK